MVPFKRLLSSLTMLVMASAQSTSLPTTINTDLTSLVQTSYTLTDTSIVTATGSPPVVISTTINIASTATSPVSTSSSSSAATSPQTLSVPAIVGIALGGAVLLIAAITLIICACIKRSRKAADRWPDLPIEKVGRSTLDRTKSRSRSIRRPSSAATLVADDPTEASAPCSKASMECYPSKPLSHSKSARSVQSSRSRSASLERTGMSEVPPNEFNFEFDMPLSGASTPPPPPQAEVQVAQVNADTLQKLSLDKSLPSSPALEAPTYALQLDLENLNNLAVVQVEQYGRPRSSVYSTTATGGLVKQNQSQSYF